MQTINAVDMKDYDVILGTPWLQRVNPNIDWHEDMWEYKNGCVGKIIQTISKDQVDWKLHKGSIIYVAYASIIDMGALQLQAACILKEDLLQKTTDLPEQYKDYTNVASEEKAGILSLHQAHNHHIELKPGTTSLH